MDPNQAWHTMEQFSEAKHDAPNEDVIVTTPWCVAVIDGATDKSGLTYDYAGQRVSSGYFAAHSIADCLRACSGDSTPVAVVKALTDDLNTRLSSQYRQLPASARPSASVVVFNTVTDHLWWVGDCQAAWVTTTNDALSIETGKLIDHVTAHARAATIQALRLTGEPVDGDPGRDLILPLLQRQGVFANNTASPYGYGVINGTPVPTPA